MFELAAFLNSPLQAYGVDVLDKDEWKVEDGARKSSACSTGGAFGWRCSGRGPMGRTALCWHERGGGAAAQQGVSCQLVQHVAVQPLPRGPRHDGGGGRALL